MSNDQFDRAIMLRCLELARKALGQTAPNPLVGSAIVREGRIVGEGYHPGAGHPHAEVFALREAGELAHGATVYVNLEPCNHYGRTPPCTEALISAGVAKAIVGTIDPDPRVSGSGVRRLREAGIDVVVGVEEDACRQLNEAFIHRVLYRRPFGILKFAMTLDGKIATTAGDSAWVTDKSTRNRVHQLRVACDAVIVGGNTVRLDNPHLTSHQEGQHNPLRVVMSRTLNLPEEAYLWQTESASTLVLTEMGVKPDFQRFLRSRGVMVVEVERLTTASALAYLYDRSLLSVLWECGGTLAARAIAEGTVQKILAFIAPKIVGGDTAPTPVGELGFTKMSQALTLERVSWQNIGQDCLMEGYLPAEVWSNL